jgi:hypothetical protein
MNDAKAKEQATDQPAEMITEPVIRIHC